MSLTVPAIAKSEKEQMLLWVRNWQRVGPLLDEIRAQEIRDTNTMSAMNILGGMFSQAVRTMPERESSGLVEQQRIFARARK